MAIVPVEPTDKRNKKKSEPVYLELPSFIHDEKEYYKNRVKELEENQKKLQQTINELKHYELLASAFMVHCFGLNKEIPLTQCKVRIANLLCKGCSNRTIKLSKIC